MLGPTHAPSGLDTGPASVLLLIEWRQSLEELGQEASLLGLEELKDLFALGRL